MLCSVSGSEESNRESQTERHVFNASAASRIDLTDFTVPVAKFMKNKIENRSLGMVKMNQYKNISNEAAVGHQENIEQAPNPEDGSGEIP